MESLSPVSYTSLPLFILANCTFCRLPPLPVPMYVQLTQPVTINLSC